MPMSPDRLSRSSSKTRFRDTDFLAASVIVAYLSLWQIRVVGDLSWTAFGSFALFVFLCIAYGRMFHLVTGGFSNKAAGLPFQFLCGFFVFNTSLFALSLISTLGMLGNVLILAFGAFAVLLIGVGRQRETDVEQQDLPNILSVIISGAAATLWCSDSQPQLFISGPNAIYQTWQDTFIHVRQISVFAQAHGIGTIQDIKLSGVPAPIYHFASYLSAAAVSVLSSTPAIDVYSGFQLPLGIFLTGLAAFSLIASIWGGWPALAAVAAVLLLPDAYQQGFANKYLSYNFLAQINLGMLYGIACAAIAWIFILDGSRRGNAVSVLVGYLFLGVCLLYKAHIFVANAFLIMIYPCLFFAGVKPRWRVVIGVALTALFLSTVFVSQSIDRVPVLRLDGSGIGQYVLVLLKDFEVGVLKTFFTQVFIHEHHSKPVEALYAVAMLLLSTFGIWIVAAPLVALTAKKRISNAVLLFPVIVVVNYLVMSIGLAMDTRGVGTPDELLNRPLVWAYFVVVAWTAGAGYYLVIGDRLPQSRVAQIGLLALICLSLASPLHFSKNLQTFPTRQGFAKYDEFNSVPLCLLKAVQYIKDHSSPNDIIQDSENDPRFVVTALAERQRFAGVSVFWQPTIELQKRLDELADFKLMRSADDLNAYASSHHISWYLLHPNTSISWPSSFLENSAFECSGYRAYRFEQ